jgi:hypothetical protein
MTANMTPLVHVMAQLIAPPPGHHHIFAFDLLMREDRIRQYCPSARLVSTARLLSRRWIVNQDGIATIMPCRNSVVHGVVWTITDREQADLETQLGFPSSVDRFGAFTRGPDEEMITTEFYASRNHRHGEVGWPDIIQLMATGRELGFPEEYLNDFGMWAPPPVEYEGPRLMR